MTHRFLSSLLLSSLVACASTGGDDDSTQSDPDALVTVSDDGFFVDGELRWSASGTPEVRGSVEDPRTTIEVMNGDVLLGMATVDGSSWTFTFPAGTIDAAPTQISFVARIGEGPQTVVQRTYAVDTTPPQLASMATTIANELSDVVVFSSVDGSISSHQHPGPSIMLGASPTSCPDVFKHAYLMVPGDSNPIRWRLVASDDGVGIDPATAMVRFGVQGGAFGPWRPVTAPVANDQLVVDVDVVRSGPTGDPFVATFDGKLVVQMMAADRFGRTSTVERCWTNHPLAPPLHATAAVEATGHAFALKGNSLADFGHHNLESDLINPDGAGLSVMDYEITNPTEDPAFVTFTLERPTVTTRRNYVRQSALHQTVTHLGPGVPCNSSPNACIAAQHLAPFSLTGTARQETLDHYGVRVFRLHPNGALDEEVPSLDADFATGKFRFELAGRADAAAGPPRYRVMTGLRRITALIPGGATGDTAAPLAISETALVAGASTFTIAGELIGALYAGCTIVSANGLECVQQQFFQHYRALTRAEVALGGTLRNQASASPTVDIAPRALGPLSTPRSIDGFSYGTSEIALPPGF